MSRDQSFGRKTPFIFAFISLFVVAASAAWDPAGWVPPNAGQWVKLDSQFLVATTSAGWGGPSGAVMVDHVNGDLYAYHCPALFKSTNYGGSFSPVMTGFCWTESWESILINPENHNQMVVFTITGSAYTANGGTTWKFLNPLPIQYNIEIGMFNWNDDCKLLMCRGHNGPSRMWISKDSGMTYTAIDSLAGKTVRNNDYNFGILENGVLVAQEGNCDYWIGSHNMGPLLRSVDTGRTWDTVPRPAFNGSDMCANNGLHFIGLTKRFKGKTYWLANGGIYTTPDTGKSWTLVGNHFPDSLTTAGGSVKTWTFGVDENHMIVMFVDRFLETVDGGQTWHTLAPAYGAMQGQPYTFSFDYDPVNDILYAQHNAGESGLFIYEFFVRLNLGRWPKTVVENKTVSTPASAGLSLVSANPFGNSMRLRYETTAQATVRLSVFDFSGKMVKPLVSGNMGSGLHECVWDGRNLHGVHVPAGVYLVRFESAGCVKTIRAVVVR